MEIVALQRQQTWKAQSSIISWDLLLFALTLNEPLAGWLLCEEIRNCICHFFLSLSFLSGLLWFIEPLLASLTLLHCRKRTLLWGNGQLLQTLLYQSHAYQQWQQWRLLSLKRLFASDNTTALLKADSWTCILRILLHWWLNTWSHSWTVNTRILRYLVV